MLLKLILGLLRPTRGYVVFDGKRIDELSDRELTAERARFGFVFQNAALFDSMTVAENVAIGPEAQLSSRRPWGQLFGPLKDVIASDHVERWRLLLAVGVLGGFTTFSSFSLETVLMLERRAYVLAGLYVSLSVVLSIAAVALGLFVTRRIVAG